jgi:hypothetical protein
MRVARNLRSDYATYSAIMGVIAGVLPQELCADRNNGPYMHFFLAAHLGIGGNIKPYRLGVHPVDRNAPCMFLFSVIYLGIVGDNAGNVALVQRDAI